MKAFVSPHQGATTIESADVPIPQIDPDEVLVSVKAVGVGIHDSYFLPPQAKYPFPIGIEAAGVVEQVGAQVTDHKSGDRIAFVSSMQPKGGTWAEYVAVNANSLIIPIPDDLEFVRAAAIPVAGNTVLKTLHLFDSLPAGGSLFFAGGSGAIGTLGIQIARKRGWRVAASASEANHDYLLSLGAELAVDYRDPEWPAQVRAWMPDGVTGALAIQPGTAVESFPVVCDGGIVVPISGDRAQPDRGIQLVMIPFQADVRAEMAKLLVDVAAGDIHVEVQNIFPFEEAPAALANAQTRRARGKSVLLLG